jgi:hypothetical protein
MAVMAIIVTDVTARLVTIPRARRLDWAIALTASRDPGGHEVAQNPDLHRSNNEGGFTAFSDAKSAEIKSDIHASRIALMLS